MRFLPIALASLLGLAAALPATDSHSSGLEKRAGTITTISGLKFNIDGATGYYAGTNAYWLTFLTSNADVDGVFTQLAANGLKVLRIWGFNDITAATDQVWFQSFIAGQAPVINTGANGLQRLDYAVSSAESHGIKLIINFVNNWSDYGGMPAYNTYYGTDKTTWYTNTAVQTQYKAYIKAVVSRYINSPAVFAWELANEPRCNGCPTSIITNWATTISAYIKSLDPNHLVTLGDEGFGLATSTDGSYPFSFGEGLDFAANLAIKTLDFGTFHLYPSHWGTTNDWGNLWITAHAAACVAAKKPCVFEEYGVTTDKTAVESVWQATALKTSGIAGDNFWQLGTTLAGGWVTHDDGFTIYLGSSDSTSLVTNHVAAIKAANGGSVSSSSTTKAATSTTTKPVTTTTTKATTTTTTKRVTTTTSKPTTTTSKATTTVSSTKAATTTPAAGGTIPKFWQCGGREWTGFGTCVAGTTCVYQSDFYSQCL